MRYQRHTDNYYLLHAKEVVDMLERVVREEHPDHIILAGDEVIVPLLRDQLPPHLAAKVIDVLRLDIRTPEHEVLNATLETLQDHNIHTDAERVRRLLDECGAEGLAVVGVHDSLEALFRGQVDELLVSASAAELVCEEEEIAIMSAIADAGNRMRDHREPHVVAADLLVRQARRTGARTIFIEDTALLASVGGCGVLLRYRL